MKILIILGASDLQLPVILKAKEKGIYTIVFDMNPRAVGVSYADHFEPISTTDLAAIVGYAKRINPDGIMTAASDRPMKAVAAVCTELGLPGISIDVAERATNKASMRLALRKSKVPIPKFFIVRNYEEYTQAVSNFKTKYIVKPADNSGSRGITLVESCRDSETAYYCSMDNSSNGYILVEEYVEGPEVSVETITYNSSTSIIAITDKITSGQPSFVELGHTQPSFLSKEIQAEITRISIQAINAIGIDNSPSHVEIKVTESGPKIIELGARLGGDCITSHLVPYSTGVDMVGAAIDLALGNKPEIEIISSKASAIRYFKQCPGVIQEINNPVYLPKEVKVLHFTKGEGDLIQDVHDSSDRVGYVISQADTREEAIKTCEMVLAQNLYSIDISEGRTVKL